MTRVAHHRQDFALLLAEMDAADLDDLVSRRIRACVPLSSEDAAEVLRRRRELMRDNETPRNGRPH